MSEDDRVAIQRVQQKLERDAALDASARVNPRDKARLTFDHKLQDVFQQLVESNFQLYKRIKLAPDDAREYVRTRFSARSTS